MELGPVPDAGPVVSLWVDANRDGVLSAADEEGQDSWTRERGAIFLANVDDDDDDGDPDADDTEVNGESDALDLARVQITSWTDAPDGAHATLEIDESERVRSYRLRGEAWTSVDAARVALDTATLRAGVTFGVEGRKLLEGDGWDGRVTLTLTVHEMAGEAQAPLVAWTAVLRQAPIVVGWNTAPTLRVFASDTWSDGLPLLSALEVAAFDVDVESYIIDGWDPEYLVGGYPDQWTQDFFEIGAAYLPVVGGINRMGVGIRLKPPYESGQFVENELFGPDFAVLLPFPATYNPNTDGASLDYGGNLEVVPPYDGYPVGRLLMGSVPARRPDATYFATLGSQYAQAPVLEGDTSWLVVGHIDEVVSFVAHPSSERGWKAVLQAPGEAWQMLLDLVEDDPANADLVLFQGRNWLDFDSGDPYPADITVGEILADGDLAAAQDVGQARADELRELLVAEIGLTDDDFVELPFLWDAFAAAPDGGLRHVAFSPGVVNLLTFEGQAVVARPYGPVVGTQDIFEQVTRDRLEALGLAVTFVNDWDLYHRLEGEVHCGTNVDRTIPEGVAWWEMSR